MTSRFEGRFFVRRVFALDSNFCHYCRSNAHQAASRLLFDDLIFIVWHVWGCGVWGDVGQSADIKHAWWRVDSYVSERDLKFQERADSETSSKDSATIMFFLAEPLSLCYMDAFFWTMVSLYSSHYELLHRRPPWVVNGSTEEFYYWW